MKVRYFALSVVLLLLLPAYIAFRSYVFYEDQQPPRDVRQVRKLDLNQKGRYLEMVAAYERLVRKYSNRNDLNYNLAWAYHKTGNHDGARRYSLLYMENNPFFPEWQKPYLERMSRYST